MLISLANSEERAQKQVGKRRKVKERKKKREKGGNRELKEQQQH